MKTLKQDPVLYYTPQHNTITCPNADTGAVQYIFLRTHACRSPTLSSGLRPFLPPSTQDTYNLSSTHRTPSAGHTYIIMPRPNARNLLVTFDAFGTLFKPRLPVPLQYIAVAEEYGVTGLTEKQVDSSFREGRCVRIFCDPVAYRTCWLPSWCLRGLFAYSNPTCPRCIWLLLQHQGYYNLAFNNMVRSVVWATMRGQARDDVNFQRLTDDSGSRGILS